MLNAFTYFRRHVNETSGERPSPQFRIYSCSIETFPWEKPWPFWLDLQAPSFASRHFSAVSLFALVSGLPQYGPKLLE